VPSEVQQFPANPGSECAGDGSTIRTQVGLLDLEIGQLKVPAFLLSEVPISKTFPPFRQASLYSICVPPVFPRIGSGALHQANGQVFRNRLNFR
jgi:hypothetical protein